MAASTRIDDGSVTLENVRQAVDSLYMFRDNYFETHSLDKAPNKLEDMKNELDRTLSVLDTVDDCIRGKAEYLLQRGRALNVMPSYCKESEELLSKAVKLDPKLAEAWVYLGECYWKNNQIELARNCFEGSLSHSKHKLAQRNLSMVLRQIGSTPAERTKNIEDSVELAKQAVQMDITDGRSWFVLGNAYLTKFFTCGQNSAVLKQSLSAYQQAEKDPIANCNPDLHYNRAIYEVHVVGCSIDVKRSQRRAVVMIPTELYQFEEEYDLAFVGFARAVALDPTFSEARDKMLSLVQYLNTVSQMIETKGKVRGKKLQSLVSSISSDRSVLGPYSGSVKIGDSDASITLHPTSLRELNSGLNRERVVVGRVVGSVNSDDDIKFTFCIVDQESTCFGVTVYNMVQGWGVKIGDSVAIPEPFVQLIDVQYEAQIFRFSSIRVSSPAVLVINGRKLTSAAQALSTLTTCVRSE